MDAKEYWLVRQLHARIQSGHFCELDVLALLIALRRHAAPHSLALEWGDFVAHREKDRGLLKRHLESARNVILGKEPTSNTPTSFAVYGPQDVQHSINSVLSAMGLSELNEEIGNRLTVGIISLLQSVEIHDHSVSAVPKLVVGVTWDFIALLGQGRSDAGHVFVFPMLVARNRYLDLPIGTEGWLLLDRVVSIGSRGGEFTFEQCAPAA
jgi:hypothetical protein